MFPTHTSVFCFEEQISSRKLSHQEPCYYMRGISVAGDAPWRVTLFRIKPCDRQLAGQVFSWCESAALYQLQQVFMAFENLA